VERERERERESNIKQTRLIYQKTNLVSQQNLRAYITGFFFFFFVLRVCPHTFVSVFFLLLGLLLLPSHFSFLALFCFLFLLWFLIMLILMFLFAPCRSSQSLLSCVLVGFAGRSSVSIVCCELLRLRRFFFVAVFHCLLGCCCAFLFSLCHSIPFPFYVSISYLF